MFDNMKTRVVILNYRVLAVLVLCGILALIPLGSGTLLKTAAALQSGTARVYLPAIYKNAVEETVGETSEISGTVNVDRLSVSTLLTLKTTGDTTVNSAGPVNIEGSVLTDGGNLTINANGDVRVTGTIKPAVATATATSPGNIDITGSSITVQAGDPARVVIQSLGKITLRTVPGVTSRSAPMDVGVIYVGGSMKAGEGRHGGTSTEEPPTSGGDIHLIGPVTAAARTLLEAGDGGWGVSPEANGLPGCPGESVSATGGPGANGGSILLGIVSPSADSPWWPVVINGELEIGAGGFGGTATVRPGDGAEPGCDGGNGTAVGGVGGKGGSLYVAPGATIASYSVVGGLGGFGGDAKGERGHGSDGQFPGTGKGGAGGNFSLQGGRGGDPSPSVPTELAGGGGRPDLRDAARGGKGANGCAAQPKRAGGDGGRGGNLTLHVGPDGISGSTERTKLYVKESANGGDGGPGTIGGAGGLAGVIVGSAGIPVITDSLTPGSPGPEGCPIITIIPQTAPSGTYRTLGLSRFLPGEVVKVIYRQVGGTEVLGPFVYTMDSKGGHTQIINLTKTYRATATGFTSGGEDWTDITSTVP